MIVRGLICDLDGTLIDSNLAHVEAWRRAFAHLGYDVSAGRLTKLMGMGGDKLVPAAVGEAAAWRHGDDLRTAHGKHFAAVASEQGLKVFPGAVELLRDARRMGVKVALATSGSRAYLVTSFATCGHDFGPDVDALVTADESKPEPDLTHAAADRLGLDALDCALIGDTPYDGESATRAGACFWAVQSGGFEAADLWAAGADRVFADVAAVWRHLDDLLLPASCVQRAAG